MKNMCFLAHQISNSSRVHVEIHKKTQAAGNNILMLFRILALYLFDIIELRKKEDEKLMSFSPTHGYLLVT